MVSCKLCPLIEAQLDHEVDSKVKVAYDRGKRLDRRAELLEWYEGGIYAARDGTNVVNLSSRKSSA